MLYALSINTRIRELGRRGVHMLKVRCRLLIQEVIIRVSRVNSDIR